MKRLLIAGWRGINHSFALVNQHQILSLARRGDISLNHVDMPMAQWSGRDHDAGFGPNERAFIDALQPTDEASVDCVYRIAAPMSPPSREARRTLTFGVTELGYTSNNLSNPDQDLACFTSGENLVVTPSRWSRDRLIDFGFDEAKVRVIRHGVDLNVFRPLTADEIAVNRKSLAIPDDAVVFLNVGVPTWNKGVDLLIRTFASVHSRYPNTRLILKDSRGLYGYSADNVISSIISSHPGLLTPNVLAAISLVTSNLSQVELCWLYGFVDWYVSPYRAEGFNLPVLEAQACATPVITSSGGATDDFCDTDGVRKIASVFHRGSLTGHANCCWVEPDLSALEALMVRAAEEGPRQPYVEDPLRQQARANAELHTWDEAIASLVPLL